MSCGISEAKRDVKLRADPIALGFAKITHCAWPLLRGELP